MGEQDLGGEAKVVVEGGDSVDHNDPEIEDEERNADAEEEQSGDLRVLLSAGF